MMLRRSSPRSRPAAGCRYVPTGMHPSRSSWCLRLCEVEEAHDVAQPSTQRADAYCWSGVTTIARAPASSTMPTTARRSRKRLSGTDTAPAPAPVRGAPSARRCSSDRDPSPRPMPRLWSAFASGSDFPRTPPVLPPSSQTSASRCRRQRPCRARISGSSGDGASNRSWLLRTTATRTAAATPGPRQRHARCAQNE
jgi:hypothetical protein